MQRRIELIVTDLDGTFLNSYHELNEENIEAVHLAQKHGIPVPVNDWLYQRIQEMESAY